MRPLRLLLAGLGLVMIAIVFVYLTKVRDEGDGALCHGQYAKAHSAADTSRIDAQLPPRERTGAEYTGPNPTCGELRQLGRT